MYLGVGVSFPNFSNTPCRKYLVDVYPLTNIKKNINTDFTVIFHVFVFKKKEKSWG